MPVPLPPQHSKRETRKSQSSIVPSDHEPSEKKDEKYQAKISPSSPQGPLKKRSAFEDLTNAPQSQHVQPKKEANNEFVKDTSKKRNKERLPENNKMNIKRCKVELSPIIVSTTMVPNIIDNLLTLDMSTSSKTPNTEEASIFKEPFILKEEPTSEDAVLTKRSLSSNKCTNQEMIPLGNTDIDCSDPLFSSVYAKDIFSYMKKREEKFILKKYMTRQTDIDSDMRAILVDWLVEVQMTFEMSHETLYLAVKLVDHYLMKVICKKDKLQLLGSTAFMIAAKFEERCPPSVNDFLYICNDIYKRDEMLAMEASILKILKFDINIPIAYHFLRRYARCVYASMKTLTLSRFICELTLLEYDYVQERASKLAAASFFLALCMNKLGHWAPILEYYSGYRISDLHALVRQLNILLTFHSCNRLKTVCSKYSHEIFFEVAKIPPLDMLALEKILRCC
ncbi:G2/mitotic-specific cyclin-B3 isoform X5 [Ovis aries]|uniref:G2/mitotic-specific cyclin-B3 isoform X5 n=1 Tax=Ovis aries TaxID=9940 RepID=UPI0005FADC44|nr:G2/mitotic-specific cyclin-B3 isoform X5 [Ovis aries]XP_060264300.1 G2/mitotic-specific cyclin-B3 isoform X5 [Ovis aries]